MLLIHIHSRLQEVQMADQQLSAQSGTAPTTPTGRRFVDMRFSEKIVFIGKAFVMLCTGGFMYPNIWVD
jgi:hypothetical protein